MLVVPLQLQLAVMANNALPVKIAGNFLRGLPKTVQCQSNL
jgi:hypothetical protein